MTMATYLDSVTEVIGICILVGSTENFVSKERTTENNA